MEARPEDVETIDGVIRALYEVLSGPAGPRDWERERNSLIELIPTLPGKIILVSNEVGMGIVPMGEINRRFQDEQGRLNQALAAACDHVVFMAAGLPLMLKGSP